MPSLSSVVIELKLSRSALRAVRAPIRGQGGFQSAIGHLQDLTSRDGVMRLEAVDLARLIRLATKYRQGGFQNRLKPVLTELKNLAIILVPLNDLATADDSAEQ